MIHILNRDPISGIGESTPIAIPPAVPCFYWSHPLSCKRNSSSGLAPVILSEKGQVLFDSTSLLCKVEPATL